jgi:glycosyltransferase involved in cell wall biosynthesis
VLQRLEARRLLAYERDTFAQMDRVLVCSGREAEALAEWGLGDRSQVVPNGVDCEYFAPPDRGYAANPPVLVFTGAMSYGPNADAALHFIANTLPLLRPRVPGVRFVVVGKSPTEALVEAARRNPDVTVTGTVPDVREYVHGARIFVVPLRMGAGTRLKVLEAFALGIPAVSTPVGAEGIDYEETRHLLIAETPARMADAVCRLLEDAELARRMSRESRELALSRYDWNAVGERLLAEYESDPASAGAANVAVDTKR